MIVSIIGKKYGKETATLLTICNELPVEVFLKLPEKGVADIWVITDWDAQVCAAVKNNIRPQDTVVLNSDDEVLLQKMAGIVCHIVTFGYHLKSTVTISGREEDMATGGVSYTFALQRPVLTYQKKVLEPCEMKWSAPVWMSPQSVMASVAFFLVADVAFFP